MLIQAYRVESHRHGSIAFQPEPVWVGTIQFTDRFEQEHSEETATERLSLFSRLTDDPHLGFQTWEAELTGVDDEALGTPSVEETSKGFRIWLPS